jgi:protein-disulfide isomerase
MVRLVDLIGPNDHVIGPETAPAQLVEYGDYECPYCGRAYRAVGETLRRVGQVVRFAFRHFPLPGIHPNAATAAQAAEAAGAQGQFWPMHALLFENQNALEPDDLLSYAEAIAIDVVRFAQELRQETYLPRVQADLRGGLRSGVNGTPTFFLNGERFDPPWDPDTLTAAIGQVTGTGTGAGPGAGAPWPSSGGPGLSPSRRPQ